MKIIGVFLSRIWGNKFHVEPNYKPWKFPLDVRPLIQNDTGYPTTESSAIMNFPRPETQKVKKKKKGIGAGSTFLLVGGLALLGTFFALFAVRMNHRRAQNLAAIHRSNNSIAYSLPVSTGRGDICLSLPSFLQWPFWFPGADFLPSHVTEYPVATEDNPQIKRFQPPPAPQLRHLPSPPVRIDKSARRKSFSATCQYPSFAKLFSAAELQLATNCFSEENLLGEGPLGSVYRAKLPDGQVYLSSLSSNIQNWEFYYLCLIHWCFVKTVCRRQKHPNVFAIFTWRGTVYWSASDSLQTKTPKHCYTSRFLHWEWRASSCLWVCWPFVVVQCYAWWGIQATFLGLASPHCYWSCPSSGVSILSSQTSGSSYSLPLQLFILTLPYLVNQKLSAICTRRFALL